MAQTVKNRSTMQGTWIRSLGREDPLEEGRATHYSILAQLLINWLTGANQAADRR